MDAITAFLERSLSLNNHQMSSSSSSRKRSEEEEEVGNDTVLELNSDVSLPYQWEQCLDLKTGEIYFRNRRNGMKAKEDPRRSSRASGGAQESSSGDQSSTYYSSTDEEEDSDQSSKEVLVVAGCKTCLMYVMVPKQLQHCPKCTAQLLHFHPYSP